MITEVNLLEFGFKRQFETTESSGEDQDWYYYTLDIGDAWYTEWTMTMQEYEDWKVWGKKYLIKNLRLNAKIAEREMLWVGVQWGLKCRDYESYIEKQNEQSI